MSDLMPGGLDGPEDALIAKSSILVTKSIICRRESALADCLEAVMRCRGGNWALPATGLGSFAADLCGCASGKAGIVRNPPGCLTSLPPEGQRECSAVTVCPSAQVRAAPGRAADCGTLTCKTSTSGI